MVHFGMFEPGVSAFRSSFELWREEGVILLVMARGTFMQVRDMKEVLRLIGALDPASKAPLLLECDGCIVHPEALDLLCRVRQAYALPVALCTRDARVRYQAAHMRCARGSSFRFKLFEDRSKALVWVRERVQLVEIMG
jgi:hypothetical protein